MMADVVITLFLFQIAMMRRTISSEEVDIVKRAQDDTEKIAAWQLSGVVASRMTNTSTTVKRANTRARE